MQLFGSYLHINTEISLGTTATPWHWQVATANGNISPWSFFFLCALKDFISTANWQGEQCKSRNCCYLCINLIYCVTLNVYTRFTLPLLENSLVEQKQSSLFIVSISFTKPNRFFLSASKLALCLLFHLSCYFSLFSSSPLANSSTVTNSCLSA
jgi:hypothetical protein